MEKLSKTGTNSRTRQYDRSLSPHRSTEADGDARGDNAGPCVVWLNTTLFTGDGIENLSDPVSDIIADHIADK